MNKMSGLKRPQAVICYVTAILLIPAFFVSSHIIRAELTSYIKQTLNEISEQNVNSIQCMVEDDIKLLEEISDRIRFDDSEESVANGMKTAAEAYAYKRMEVVYNDGTVFASDEKQHNIIDDDHVQLALAGESNISDAHADSSDNEIIIAYSVPIFDRSGNNITGALIAVNNTDSFRNHLSASAFDGKGYTYIVEVNGTPVIDSAHESAYKGMTNIFEAMESVGSNDDVSLQMRNDMMTGGKGCLRYENNGKFKYINYEPLGINDWYIVTIVPADVTDGARFNIMLVVYILFAVITAAELIFVITIIKGEKIKKAELEHILYTDELTGGMSFAKFCIDAAYRIENRHEKSQKAACVMTDLENFRLINNLYGKAEGDKTIINSYKAFGSVLGDGDLLARQSADKFYALIFFEEKEELEGKLNDFIVKLKKSSSENEYILNPSIGVYIADTAGEDIETITNNATIAHDTIGINSDRIVFYDETQRDKLKTNKILEDKMELAHQNHEFIPYYQPKYNAETGEICGAEALIRWKNPDGTVTPPGKFIPLAESNGFIRVLDRDVFNAVCAFQKSVLESGGRCVPISVNVSRQLMYEQNFASDYVETIKKYGLSSELIELEITESVLFDDYGVFKSIINTLRESGFKILMDDFGTGYSSLIMLGSVPIDNLKLDKSFVDSFEEEKGRKIIVCVIELAKSLDLPLTAEGVETQGQLDFLKSMGCNVIQGYYFSKPVPEDVFREMLSGKKENA